MKEEKSNIETNTAPTVKNLNTEQYIIQNLNKNNDILNQLSSTSSLSVVNKASSSCARCCVPCCCCCSDKFEYYTLIKDKKILESKGQLSCKISSTERISNFDYCNSFRLSSSQEISPNKEQALFSEMRKISGNSLCFGIGKLKFKVSIPNENRIVGIIQFGNDCCEDTEALDDVECCGINCCEIIKCCKDEKCCYEEVKCCEIFKPTNEENKNKNKNEAEYTIYLSKCRIPCNICGDPKFIIKNRKDNNVGEIKISKSCCNLCGICKDNLKYNITFPIETTPELKLTIINALFTLDMAFI